MSSTLTCPQCTAEFKQPPPRGKPQVYCGRPCQITAANQRRATTRKGRLGQANPQPLAPTPVKLRPTVDRSPSERQDTPSNRLSELMAKAHSRGGIDAWEIAELAKLRGISPWAPARVIMAKETRK
jgi:hypothetical protein